MKSVSLVAYFTICVIASYLSLSITLGVQSLRFPKENTRPKTKCQRNPADQQANEHQPRCVALNNPYCLDIKLPYNSTYIPDNLHDLNLRSFEDVNNYLQRWNGVKKLPKCWPVLQVALCSMLMPQCDENYQTNRVIRVHQPSVDICNDLVNKPECKFIDRQLDWPTIFNCNDTNLYAKNCTNELRDLKYSNLFSQSICQYPLVNTSDESSWFGEIGGCALHCKFPISSRLDQANISLFKRTLTLIGLCCTIATMILFRANQARSKNSRLDKVIKRCNTCQFFLYVGWLLQIILNDDIACSPSGSALFGQPLVASPCVLSFLLTYLPSLSSLFWCAYFGKLTCESLMGKCESKKSPIKTELDPTLSFFNYGVPLILFLCVAFLGHIDGHGLYGICTVGQQSMWIKIIFVFLPLVFGTIYGNYYLIRIIIKLAFIKEPSIRRILMRISAQAALTIMQAVFTIGNYFYELENRPRWHESIEKFITCNLNLPNDYLFGPAAEAALRQPECQIDTKPIVTVYYLELLSNLGLGIVISSWLFKEKNFQGLRRFLIDLLEDEEYKKKRAREYEVAAGRTNVWVANGSEFAVVDESFHDLVDINSKANVVLARREGGDELDVAVKETERQLLGRIAQQPPRAASRLPSETPMSRRSSLISTSLEMPILQARPNRFNERTSRDVVEEMRMPVQASNGMPIQQQMDSELLAKLTSMMLQEYEKFAGQNNIDQQTHERFRTPNLVHGVCDRKMHNVELNSNGDNQREMSTIEQDK